LRAARRLLKQWVSNPKENAVKLRYLVLFVFAACATDDPTGSTPGTPPGTPPANCPSTVVDAPAGASCAKATQTCMTACAEEDETCFDNCFAADPNAEACGECLESAYVSCANAAGCQAAYDAQECCVGTCADPDSDECYSTTCANEVAAYESCTEDKECTDAVCFAAT
jgi:hypothetical protein